MALILITLWVLAQIEARAAPVAPTIFIGDSIMHAGSWAKRCRGAVILAQPSGTSRDILRLTPHAASIDPGTAVVMIGVNDIALNIPPDETLSNISAIVASLESYGHTVALHAILPVTDLYPRPGYNERIEWLNARLSRDHRLIHLGIPPKAYMADGLHLRDAGYAVWLAHLRSIGICR